MNIFFYSATTTPCNRLCQFRTCCKRCLSLLKDQPFFDNLRLLPGGSELKTPLAMELRSGDIIILYAENREGIDNLVAIRNVFDTFRIILLFGEEDLIRYGHHFLLNPRYTLPIGKKMNSLGAVVHRMVAGHDQPSVFMLKKQDNNYA